MHPTGDFVVTSNRGHDSVAVHRIHRDSTPKGMLTLAGIFHTRGETPRHFQFDKSGQWLLVANQDSNTCAVFNFNCSTGQVRRTPRAMPTQQRPDTSRCHFASPPRPASPGLVMASRSGKLYGQHVLVPEPQLCLCVGWGVGRRALQASVTVTRRAQQSLRHGYRKCMVCRLMGEIGGLCAATVPRLQLAQR